MMMGDLKDGQVTGLTQCAAPGCGIGVPGGGGYCPAHSPTAFGQARQRISTDEERLWVLEMRLLPEFRDPRSSAGDLWERVEALEGRAKAEDEGLRASVEAEIQSYDGGLRVPPISPANAHEAGDCGVRAAAFPGLREARRETESYAAARCVEVYDQRHPAPGMEEPKTVTVAEVVHP